MPSQRETAQRKRADAREQRRKKPADEPNESADESPSSDGSPAEALKQAAKVAAASAALGAVAGALRAVSERRGSDDTDGSEDAEPEEPDQVVGAGAVAEQENEPEEAGEGEPDERQPDPEEEDRQQPREEPPPPRHQEPVAGATPDEARDATEQAKRQLAALVGKEPETVSSFERTGDGWLVTVEVLEVSRVPESTDVLASYQVELDDNLNLRRYARVRRYHRSQADREDL